MQNPQQIEARVEARHRVILIIWFALLMSISLFLGLTFVIPGNTAAPNMTLSFMFIGLAFLLVVASVLMKSRVVQRAIEKHDPVLLQSGYIIAFALCESAAIWGLVDHISTGSKYYFASFAIGVLGMLVHFPKKDHVRAATA